MKTGDVSVNQRQQTRTSVSHKHEPIDVLTITRPQTIDSETLSICLGLRSLMAWSGAMTADVDSVTLPGRRVIGADSTRRYA